MKALREHPIAMRDLIDAGLPTPIWGRFNGAELIFAVATLPTGQPKTWTREPRESAEIFAARVVRDCIEAARGQCVGVLVA